MSSDHKPPPGPPDPLVADPDSVPLWQPGTGFLLDDDFGRTPASAVNNQSSSPSSPDDDPNRSAPDPSGSELVDIFRILGGGLIVLAFLIFLGSRSLPFPVLMLIAGLILIFVAGSPDRLRREQIIDRWDLLISGGQGQGDAVVSATIFQIDQQQLPGVSYKQADFSPGIARGLAGSTRPFLVISQSGNRRLQPYRMHVNVRDYGNNLQTSWFLSYHRSFFERIKPNPLVRLDLFDEQDLRAYVTAVHHCFTDSVVDLVSSLGQDTSQVDRSSKGFLGIS